MMRRAEDAPLVVALRCAACGKGFSVPARTLNRALIAAVERPMPPARFVALTCSDCGSGGKSEHDGCLVPLGRADLPALGPVTWEEGP
jgi:hypothetical protein